MSHPKVTTYNRTRQPNSGTKLIIKKGMKLFLEKSQTRNFADFMEYYFWPDFLVHHNDNYITQQHSDQLTIKFSNMTQPLEHSKQSKKLHMS